MQWTWNDLLPHLLLLPVYQIVSTIRHEGAHAIAGLCTGLRITAFVFWPHRHEGHFLWGRVSWEYPEGVTREQPVVDLAPYLVDAVLISIGIWAKVMVQFESFHAFAVAMIMLLISPIVDVGYNLMKYVLFRTGDFARAVEGV